MNKKELFNKMNSLDMDNIESVNKLANDYLKWCEWNKASEKIEIIKSQKFDNIIVIHKLFDILKAEDSWEFLSDIKYLLNEYSNHSKEDCNYMIDFWKTKING